jgi:tetratricopeptide (TPR) repeat protein
MYKPDLKHFHFSIFNQKAIRNCLSAIRLIILLLFPSFSFAQSDSDRLIDSLTLVKSHDEKARLGQEIAKLLCDSDWQRAVKYLEYAEEEAKVSNSEETLAEFFNTAAGIYSDKDVMDVALEYYQKAYVIYVKKADYEKMLILENNLAVIYARMNNKEMALSFFKKCYKHLDLVKQKDSVYLAKLLNNIATLYIENNQDSSIAYYQKSLEIANDLNNNQLFAYLYANLGRVYFLKTDTSKARYFLKNHCQ